MAFIFNDNTTKISAQFPYTDSTGTGEKRLTVNGLNILPEVSTSVLESLTQAVYGDVVKNTATEVNEYFKTMYANLSGSAVSLGAMTFISKTPLDAM